MEACGRCRDPKTVMIEKKLPARSSSGVPVNKPMRFTGCKKEPKMNPIMKGRPGMSAAVAAAPDQP